MACATIVGACAGCATPAEPAVAPPKKGLQAGEVRAVVMDALPRMKACWESRRRSGTITVAWKIEPRGVVSDARIKKSTVDDSELEECVRRVVAALVFSPKDEATLITGLPFRFGS